MIDLLEEQRGERKKKERKKKKKKKEQRGKCSNFNNSQLRFFIPRVLAIYAHLGSLCLAYLETCILVILMTLTHLIHSSWYEDNYHVQICHRTNNRK